MIAHVRGRLLEKHPTRLVVEVGGLGLDVAVPVPTSQAVGAVGEEVALHTTLVVREDALLLFGFSARAERDFFLKLIGVSGIGPKIALSALSGPPVEDLVAALRAQDIPFLVRIPGVGKKTAERMAVELKDALTEFEAHALPGDSRRIEVDAVAALVSLGYARALAEKAVRRAATGAEKEPSVEAVVRGALATLSAGRRP